MYNLSQIENNTSRSLITKVNEIWKVIFNIQDKDTVDTGDYIIIQEGSRLDADVGFKKVPIDILGFVQGAAGPTAYEVAVADGYTGTESEWLVSLIGPAGSDADSLYTNATPTEVAIGGIPAGSTFDAATITEMFNALLYPYQVPTFSAFSITGQSTILECGVYIASGNKTFTWTTTNPTNVTTDSLYIRDVTNSTNIATGLTDDSSEVVDIGVAITKFTTGQTQQWSINGTDTETNPIIAKTFTVSFYSPIYYGVGAIGLDAASIQQLTKLVISEASADAYNVTSHNGFRFSPTEQVFYFAYPASYGVLENIKDENLFDYTNDFGTDGTPATVSFTFQDGYYQGNAVDYYVYEFNRITTQSDFRLYFNF